VYYYIVSNYQIYYFNHSFYFQEEDVIRDRNLTRVQTCALPISKSLVMDHNYGSIAEGKVADFVVLNDDINVQATALAGEVLYEQIGRASCRRRGYKFLDYDVSKHWK